MCLKILLIYGVIVISSMTISCDSKIQRLGDHPKISERVSGVTALPIKEIRYLGGVKGGALGEARFYSVGRASVALDRFTKVSDIAGFVRVYNRMGSQFEPPLAIDPDSVFEVMQYNFPDGGTLYVYQRDTNETCLLYSSE